jgi:hypothetical protein
MRTTLTLDEDVAARLLELQRRLDVSFKDVVNLTLRKGLESSSQRMTKAPRFKVRARALGTRPGLNYDNVGELLEQIEGVGHR